MPRGKALRLKREYLSTLGPAFLNLYNLPWLQDCDLHDPPSDAVDPKVIFGRGIAQQKRLIKALNNLGSHLPDVPDRRIGRIRATVEGLLAGRSLTSISRAEGNSREFWSRDVYHAIVVPLLAEELLALEEKQAVAEGSRRA